jgi:transcriptional regulator with XRE-family HTH domain
MGDHVKSLRDSKGWTQEKLAERAGVTQSFISQIERGARVKLSLENAGKIAHALGVDVSELLKGAGR